MDNEITKEQAELYSLCFELVKDHMGWDNKKTELWFSTNNLNFGGSSPDTLFAFGRGHKVKQFIDTAVEESCPSK